MGAVGAGGKRAVISIPPCPGLRGQQNCLCDWWDYRCIAGLSLHSNRTGWNSVTLPLCCRVLWMQVHLVGDLGGPVHHEQMWPDILHLVLHYICYQHSRQYRPALVLAFNSCYQLPHLVLNVDKFTLFTWTRCGHIAPH